MQGNKIGQSELLFCVLQMGSHFIITTLFDMGPVTIFFNEEVEPPGS